MFSSSVLISIGHQPKSMEQCEYLKRNIPMKFSAESALWQLQRKSLPNFAGQTNSRRVGCRGRVFPSMGHRHGFDVHKGRRHTWSPARLPQCQCEIAGREQKPTAMLSKAVPLECCYAVGSKAQKGVLSLIFVIVLSSEQHYFGCCRCWTLFEWLFSPI